MSRFEFDAAKAHSSAKSWDGVGSEMAAIAAAASAITDGPWGGGKLGDAFSKGDGGNGFVNSRNTVQSAGTELTTYLQSFGKQLGEAATEFAKQTGSQPQDT